MRVRPLGKTGLRVSEISLGTVELGVRYGIEAPGDFGRPPEDEALQLLRTAADSGVTLFDTAPGYGESERLIGTALGSRSDCLFATKIPVPRSTDGAIRCGAALREAVESSLASSLRLLRRNVLDIVQIHNATVEVLESGELVDVLQKFQRRGWIRHLGASVYTVDEAMAVVADGRLDVLQVAYSILDQRMAVRVFAAAREVGLGVVCRSALLKGALTVKAIHLPESLSSLRQAAERVKDELAGSWDALPDIALRFCLSDPDVDTVLVGVRTLPELTRALETSACGPLASDLREKALRLGSTEERLLNPARWGLP